MSGMTISRPSSGEMHVCFMGSLSSGKTTLLNHFLGRTDERASGVKPTVALEYTYARKDEGASKIVSHIHELGGGTQLLHLLPVIKCDVAIIMLNLMEGSTVLTQLDAFYAGLQAAVEQRQKQENSSNNSNAATAAETSPIKSGLVESSLPVLCIFPTHWDEAINLESEERRILSRALRWWACRHSASLIYLSTKDRSSLSLAKNVLNSLCFEGTLPTLRHSVDHALPILACAGSEELDDIGMPGDGSTWQEMVQKAFGKRDSKVVTQERVDLEWTKFKEHAIDSIRQQKDEELQRKRREDRRY